MNKAIVHIGIIAFFFIHLSNTHAQQAEVIIGAFEFSGDIYVSYRSTSNNRFLSKKVEGYLSTDVLASTLKKAVDVVYSTKYQRLFAIYKTNSEKFVAHAIHNADENLSPKIKTAFGVVKDPDTGKSLAVYLNSENKIIAFPLD